MNDPTLTASANVNPCRFIKLTGDFRAAQCVANDQADGISREFVREAPFTGASTLAAITGEPIQYHSLGDVGEIEVGAAVVAGAWVKPDANARAIPGVANDKCSARVLRGQATVGNRALVRFVYGVA